MIYVHVPFCRSFCTYCDFYSERACPTEAYVEGVLREAVNRKDEIAATSAVNTLYFGGGTPSVLPPAVIGRIADACGGRSYDEWTVEVNPDDITPEYAASLRALGVNRVSMGVQSLDDGMLRWMARRHDADGARRAFRVLREAGFDNISVDIIFGVGGMSEAMLDATARELLEWRPEHISAYQLSIEEGSALGRLVREGRYAELPDDACAAQYGLLCRLLRDAGYEHYEISNWALPGRRAIHNSAYWTRAPYVGIGPGAHSLARIPTAAVEKAETGHPAPGSVSTLGHVRGRGPQAERSGRDERSEDLWSGMPGEANCRSWNSEELSGWSATSEVLTEEEIREEKIMLGLRTAEGIPGYGRIPEDRWFTADDIISSLI